MGNVFLYEDKDFEVEVRNRRNEVVEIGDVRADCRCADIKLEASRLGPTDSARLTGTLRGARKPGPISHRVLLMIEKPVRSQHSLRIVGNAHRRIKFSPEVVVLQPNLLEGEPGEATVALENASSESIELSVKEDLPEGVAASLKEAELAPGERCRLKIQAVAKTLTGRKAQLVITSSHPIEKTVRIPVEVRPVDSLSVAPDAIAFGVLSKSDLLGKTRVVVELSGDLLDQCDIDDVASPSYLELREVEVQASTSRRIVFEVRDAFDGADLGGMVVVSVRHRPSTRVFRVEVGVSGLLTDAS
ncbi:MAG: DUF1573 domain-containing protein [Planctomycetes bacterium]|nr:DUF1573 domain-containing protein [Planctomycetota bacterium]